MPIISVFCKKGGVGKTTFLSYLAHYLAKEGKQVLLVSADDQNSVFTIFGKEKYVTDRDDDFFDHLISGQKQPEEIVFEARERLFLMKTLNNDSISLNLTLNRPLEKRLRKTIEDFQNYFDYIFFDFPPSSSRLTEVLLDLSSQIFVICSLDSLGIDGFKNTLQFFSDQDIEFSKITHIIPAGFHPIKKAPIENLAKLKNLAASYVPEAQIATPINDKSVIKNLQETGTSLFDDEKLVDKFHEGNRIKAQENFKEVFESLNLK